MQWIPKNQYRRSLTSFLRVLRDKHMVATAGKLRQVIFEDLTINKSTTAKTPTFSSLLGPRSVTTTDGGALIVFFDASVTATAGVAAIFRIRIDGASPSGIGSANAATVTSPFNVQDASTGIYVPVTPGVHTVEVEWAKQVTAPDSASIVINPLSNSELFHANMVIMEVEQ